MSDIERCIPVWTLRHLERVPSERAVALLLRHSVREDLPPVALGHNVPITALGHDLAVDLGASMRGRIRTLHTSPVPRCIQTAEALAEGAKLDLDIVPDRLLGDPGVFVLDGQQAWKNWEQLGNEGVMQHLASERTALPGMAHPEQAACSLVRSMLETAADRQGIHVFVTHDALVWPTAARLLGKPLKLDDWPRYLEGALFWTEDGGVRVVYRNNEAVLGRSVCDFPEHGFIRADEGLSQ